MTELVPPETVFEAHTLLVKYMHSAGFARALKMIAKRPPLNLRLIGEDYYSPLAAYGEEVDAKNEAALDEYLEAHRFSFVDFWLSAGLPKVVALAMIAVPPQFTLKRYGPAINPSNWFEWFMPIKRKDGRLSANSMRRFVYSKWYFFMAVNRRAVPKPLLGFFESKRGHYVARGYDEGRARRLAMRDAMRAAVGDAWLVAMKALVDSGEASIDEVVLPYHLAKDPSLVHEMIDPGLLSEKYKGVTWKWLVESVRAPADGVKG